VHCRRCDAPVLLDPANMERRAGRTEMRCPHCGAPVPVRCTDIDRPRPGGIWSIGCYAQEPGSERDRLAQVRHRHRG